MSLTLAPVAQQQFFDDNGDPLAGGMFYTWLSGTSTPSPVYKDALMISTYTNPIVLDAAGRLPSPGTMYFDVLAYKTRLTDANGVGIGENNGYSDPVSSTALAAASSGSSYYTMGGDQETPIVLAAYPSGTLFTACHADTVFWPIDSANIIGTMAFRCMMMCTAGTVSAALVNLTDGTPDTAVVQVSSTSATGEPQTSVNITFPSGGSVKTFAVKVKCSAPTGFVWGCEIVKTS